MRAFTSPQFPAQLDGAVTLQAAIDAREGDRLPLELALYISSELGKQVAQLKAMGRGVAELDARRVWCTRQGAVWIPETSEKAGSASGLGRLVYGLLSGASEVSDWPPSYFNPGVDASLDAAVMAALNADDAQAVVDAVTVAVGQLEPGAPIESMARLVLSVPDEPLPPPAPRPPRGATFGELAAIVPPPLSLKERFKRELAAPIAVAMMVMLFGATVVTAIVQRHGPPEVEVPAVVAEAAAPALAAMGARLKSAVAKASAVKPAAVKRQGGKPHRTSIALH
jgi:hypothetical protein